MAAKLLLVDADPVVLQSVGEYFEALGYEVLREATAESGLAAFRARRPDVVLLELQLPDGDGLCLLERLAQLEAPVVMLARNGDVPTAVRAMELGAENFLSKPVQLSALAAAVARALDKPRRWRQNPPARGFRVEGSAADEPLTLDEVERRHIEHVLRKRAGNRTRAAEELGISRATLINKIKAWKLEI